LSRVSPDDESTAIPGQAGAGDPAADQPGGEHGRAGRPLLAAVGVGLGLGAVVIASLFFFTPAFALVVAAVMALAVVELARALAMTQVRVPTWPVAIGTVLTVLGAYHYGPTVLVGLFAATAVGGLFTRMRAGPAGFVRDASATVFVTAYVGLLGGFATLLARGAHGPYETLTFVAVTVASDVGGYAAGVLAGRHPMAPVISPKKSWEGFGGSALACLITGGLMVWLGTDYPWWVGLILGGAVVLVATAGDLMESMIKRDLGIKDMGTLLPGHGGIMDRLDSLLPSAFICWVIFALLH